MSEERITEETLAELERLREGVRYDYRGLRVLGRFGDAVYEAFPKLVSSLRGLDVAEVVPVPVYEAVQRRAEAAEATLVRVRELAKEYEGSHCLEDDFLPRLREALTAPVVSSDHCTGIKIDDGELGPMCSQPGCDEFHQERPPTRVHCERCPDRLAPSVSHQEDK